MFSIQEKEHINSLNFNTYRLRHLKQKDPELFSQVVEYIPYAVFTNKVSNLDINFANDSILNKGPEIQTLIEKGGSYLTQISCPRLFKHTITKLNKYKMINDNDLVFSYLQNLYIRNEWKYIYCNKVFIDEENFFNVGFFTEDMGWIGQAFEKIFDPLKKNTVVFQKFQTLTKREKQIMRLIANDNTTSEISDILCISKHSVNTHKRNIYRKLDIHKATQLIKLSIILNLI